LKNNAYEYIASASKDVLEKYGNVKDEKFFKELFKDSPDLCGQTCAWLVTGQGKELRGLYLGKYISSRDRMQANALVDCRQDMERLIGVGRAALLKEKKNVLTVNFLEGYANEP
jgi:hypothetical protein